MNESANLVSRVQNLTIEEAKKKEFINNLRGNSVLRWVGRLDKVRRYIKSLRNFDFTAQLKIESGILKLEASNFIDYLDLEFIPYVKNGYGLFDISFLMKSEITLFESEYGIVDLTDSEIKGLSDICYKFNRVLHSFNVNITSENTESLTAISDSAIILNRLLTASILLKDVRNNQCSLEYTVTNSTFQYNTIFSQDELLLLEKVKKSIQK